MSTPLTEQIRAYFDDADRQQAAVDIGAVRRGIEDGGAIMVEVSEVDGLPPNAPISGRRWPTIIIAAALVMVVVAALVVSYDRDTRERQRAAAPPIANGLIAFVGESDDNPATSDIYVAAPDGTGLRSLTSTPALVEYAPAWSPEGSRLAFVRTDDDLSNASPPCATGCQLVVVDASTGVETFSADIPQPDDAGVGTWVPWSLGWSPDGRAIAVQSTGCVVGGCGGPIGPNSVIADLETGAFTTFTPPYRAVWSPDGEWLSLNHPWIAGSSLLLVPADLIGTGDAVDVAELPGIRELLPERPGVVMGSVAWMPDSKAIVADFGPPTAEYGSDSWIDVVTVADGERRTVIEGGFDPVVSPDGSQIAYLREHGSLNEIWVAAADGNNPRRVAPVSLTSPAWSPDGSLLLAEDYQGEFTVRPDGTDRTTLGIRDHTPKFPISWVFPGSGIDWQPAGAD